MEKENHIERHKMLHKCLDELFADYVETHPELESFTQQPIINLINWSYKQTIEPDH